MVRVDDEGAKREEGEKARRAAGTRKRRARGGRNAIRARSKEVVDDSNLS